MRSNHRQHQDSVHRFIEASLDAIIIHRGLRVVHSNQCLHKLYTAEDSHQSLIGKSILELFPHDIQPTIQKRLHRGTQDIFETKILNATGEQIPVMLKSISLHYKGLPCTASIFHDLRPKHKLKDQLQAADRMTTLSLLSAGVAHEINNPLTYISLSLDELHQSLPRLKEQIVGLQDQLHKVLPAETYNKISNTLANDHLSPQHLEDLIEGVEDAMVGSQRITDIAQELRVFSDLQGEAEIVCLNKVIRSAYLLCRHRIQRKANVQLQLNEQLWIKAEHGKLIQVLINLLVSSSNEIPANQRGSITVQLEAKNNDAYIRIRTDGSHEKETDATASPTQSSVQNNADRELELSKDIIVNAAGTFSIQEDLETGKTITLCFPLAVSLHASPEDKLPYQSPKRPRVLIVEDEEPLRRQLQRALSQHFIVQSAPSGRIAFSLLQEDVEPDIILSDLHMPDGSGMDLYHWLERYQPHLCEKILYFTGATFSEKMANFLQQKSNLVLAKPLAPQQLMTIIEKMCATQQRTLEQKNERRSGPRLTTRDISGNIYLGSQIHPIQLVDFSCSGIRTNRLAQEIHYASHHMITVRLRNKRMIGEIAAHVQFRRFAKQDPCFQIQAMSPRDKGLYGKWLNIAP